ncbi:hypothetical protein BC830DRAFT_1083210 [Chytriomyces sp. MP71]|nr:hypothetical protein BC830DRAFT_1083210 [Chytriomyces sp. MP71]
MHLIGALATIAATASLALGQTSQMTGKLTSRGAQDVSGLCQTCSTKLGSEIRCSDGLVCDAVKSVCIAPSIKGASCPNGSVVTMTLTLDANTTASDSLVLSPRSTLAPQVSATSLSSVQVSQSTASAQASSSKSGALTVFAVPFFGLISAALFI